MNVQKHILTSDHADQVQNRIDYSIINKARPAGCSKRSMVLQVTRAVNTAIKHGYTNNPSARY